MLERIRNGSESKQVSPPLMRLLILSPTSSLNMLPPLCLGCFTSSSNLIRGTSNLGVLSGDSRVWNLFSIKLRSSSSASRDLSRLFRRPNADLDLLDLGLRGNLHMKKKLITSLIYYAIYTLFACNMHEIIKN